MAFEGSTRLAPPPVAPPLRPKTGPIDGWRSASADRLPIRRNACARPIDVVVLPSPAGVGVIAETRINLPRFFPACSSASRRTFALSRPYGSRCSAEIPRSVATSAIGRIPTTSLLGMDRLPRAPSNFGGLRSHSVSWTPRRGYKKTNWDYCRKLARLVERPLRAIRGYACE
jgi:hypothetical protein